MQIGVITNPNSRKNRGRHDRAATLQIFDIKPVLR
jgi:hypothetical protein